MFKKIKNLLFVCGILLLSQIPSFAFLNGGYVTGTTPGDCYITFSTITVSSNTVNVDTIRIDSVISDRNYVSTNMVNIPVSMSVTNTGVNSAQFTLDLRLYEHDLGMPGVGGAAGYTITHPTFVNPVTLPAGTSTTYAFVINFSGPIVPTFPVIAEGRATAVVAPFGNDNYWTAIDGSTVTGAVSPWFFDTRDIPLPIAVVVTPSILPAGLITINVTFNRTMTTNVAPVVQIVSPDGSVVGNYSGTWNSNLEWVGTFNVPIAWSAVTYGVSINNAVDTNGITMNVYLEMTNILRGAFIVRRTPPIPTLATVVPSPTQNGVITLNVQFDQSMTTNIQPVFEAWRGGALQATWAGSWNAPPTNTWIGTLNAGALAEGVYTVSANGAASIVGVVMIASMNICTFEIDRSPPTVNLYHNPTANPGILFPVTLVAVDSDVIPLAPVLWAQFLLMDGSVSNAPVINWASVGGLGITWSGTVLVPFTASPNTVATFNNLTVTDNAGLVSNVINSGSTFNIGAGAPFISNLTFDNAPVIDWDYIGTTPVIRFLITDGANSGGVSPNSIRITMNGVLLVSMSVTSPPVGTTPNVYLCVYQITTALNPGNYRFEFGASDVSGNAAMPVSVLLRVTNAQNPDLVREPFNGPNPFSPNGDGIDDVTFIVYELNRAAPVRIYIFNMDGEIIWRKDIDEGDEGAHAGYNSVVWDGVTSMGDALPNGVYIGHIIVRDEGEQKSLGRVRIVVLK